MGERKGVWSQINKRAFFPPAIIMLVVVIVGAVFPTQFGNASIAALNYITTEWGWLFTLGALILLCFCIWAGFSKYGKIKLGGPDAKPTMSMFQWFAVSFTASIAIGITFWCVAEPMTFFENPPTFLNIEGGTPEAALVALRYTYNHWSFIPFAIYTSAGVAIAFLYHNCKKPFRVSTALIPLLGEERTEKVGSWVDALCTFAMIGGIGTSLGLGTMQIASGIQYVFGIESSIFMLTAVIVVMACFYIFVASTGVHKGIKHVGTVNMVMYFLLMLFVLFIGPTREILENVITSAGDYIFHFIPLATNLDPIQQTGWHEGWTIFYWAWWLAFAPLTGLFMVRLAKGRTIRQFVLINLVAPAIFIFIWFGVFGSAGIFSDIFDGSSLGAAIVEFGSDIAMFELLKQYPAPIAMSVFTIILIALSFNTQAEAVTFTLASMTTVGFDESGSEKTPPRPIIIFWGALMAAFTIILLYTGGEDSMKAVQTSVVVCGFPIIFLQVLMALSYIKCMRHCKAYDKVGTFDNPLYAPIVADQADAEEARSLKLEDNKPKE